MARIGTWSGAGAVGGVEMHRREGGEGGIKRKTRVGSVRVGSVPPKACLVGLVGAGGVGRSVGRG